MSTRISVGEYLVECLRDRCVEHVFGVPGDFVLKFMDQIVRSGLRLVNTCDEQGAGFAADAYARLRGLGVACVTYGVGGLKVANATAEAFAERSPVVVVSGAPGLAERQTHAMIHHKIRDYGSQKRVFEEITCASTVIAAPETALDEIDRVLEAADRYKRPVYIELPRDQVAARGHRHHGTRTRQPRSDSEALSMALSEATERINAARQPVIVGGEEVHRFGLHDQFVEFVHRTGIPVAVTILGKSMMDEDDAAFLGVYQGGVGREEVRRYVEDSDCVIMLGVMMTDMNLGIYTARLERSRCIHAVSERIAIGHHIYEDVLFADFVAGLVDAAITPRTQIQLPLAARRDYPAAEPARPITSARLFELIEPFVREDTMVVADPGDALFGAANLPAHRAATFLSPAYYTSLGFAVPAAIGAQLASPQHRALVLVGDGAFQMTGMELSTAVRFGLDPIVIVLNNGGYVTERYIMDGPFNDILSWQYWRIPEVLGTGVGRSVKTEDELVAALASASSDRGQPQIIDVQLDPMDASPTLRRLAAGLAKGK